MTSSVFFKFKSQKDPQRVEFDGTGISVFELKRDIIIKSGLGDGKDFDLVIYTEDGKEEYDDDTTIIPRATSVMARRMPPMKPGAGRAARYMLGKMPLNIKNASRKEVANKLDTKAKPATANLSQLVTENMTEEQKMAAMFQAQSESWNATQEEMANQTRVTFGKKNHANVNVPEHDPPPGYICYRCQQKGHWIQVCPTNDDPNFDSRPKIKRTTGIPKSFLKTVEKPAALTNDGTMDDTKGPSGVMMTQDGESVVWEPDAKAWQKFQAKTKSSTAAQEATALEDKELKERGLECPLDKRQFLDPMKTPCCEKTYCNDCITNALIDSDFVCPGCQTDGCLIDDLIPDTETSKKIDAYLVEKEKAKIERARSKSPSVKPETPPSEAAKDASKTVSPESKSKSPSPIQDEVKSKSKSPIPETAPTQGKKRPAEDVLQNTPKIPKGPKAMQQQEAQKALVAQQQAMMNGMNGMNSMNGMNGMPFPMMPGFGGNGFGGMPMMPGFPMGMANPMMMPMMPNMNSFGGFPTMNSMNFNGGGFQGGMGNMGMMNNMGRGGGNMNGGATGGFTNQQKSVFAEPLQNEEDNAYFRQPVNPHRHQGRQRRTRPSDFREV